MSDNSQYIDTRTKEEHLLKKILLEGESDIPKKYIREITTFFNERKVVQRNPQIILNNTLPLSNRRDYHGDSINGGDVTKQGPEYRLRATSTANSKAVLTTRQRGNYIAGNISEAGIGTRPRSIPTGDAYMKWGPYDFNGGNRTGGYFHLDAEGLWVYLEDQGTVIDKFKQSSWNIDKMEDLNKEEILNGNVYQTVYGYYGYLPFMWEISKKKDFGPSAVSPAHYFRRSDKNVSISNPNLPITAEVDSGTTGQQIDLFIGGRQYSTYGTSKVDGRFPEISRNVTGIGSTNYVPLIAVKSKAALTNIVKVFSSINLVPNNPGYWRIVKGDAPTGGSGMQEIANNYNPTETSILVDTTATTIGSNTETLTSGIFAGGNKTTSAQSSILPDKEFFDEEVYTLEAKALGTNVDILISLVIKGLW